MRALRAVLFAVAFTVLLALPIAPGRVTSAQETLPALRAVVVATGLQYPLAYVQDPTDPRTQFVVEQFGRIRIIRDGVVLPNDFLNLEGQIDYGGERGLLGLAFAPDYAVSRRFYVNFTNTFNHTVIARYRRSASDPLRADPSSRFDLLWPSGERFIRQPYPNHNGGDIQFGSDGYLYIPLGDGGSGSDPEHRAQDPATLLGKMLRIDVGVPDADPVGYDVPPDNPFVHRKGYLPEIWAFGLRNPFRFSVDARARGGTGAIYIGDVGQGSYEEVDYEPFGAGGRNYGWRNREGAHDHVTSLPPAYLPLVDPIIEYGRDVGTVVIGGVVNRGASLGPGFFGRYFFGDFGQQKIWSARVTSTSTGDVSVSPIVEHTAELGGPLGHLSAFGLDASCRVHYVDWSGGRVVRLELADGSASGACASQPSQTGLPAPAPAAGDGGQFTVFLPEGYAWSASSNVDWFRVSPASGTGTTTMTFSVAPNLSFHPRAAVLRIGDYTFTVNQVGMTLQGGPGTPALLWQNTVTGALNAWIVDRETPVWSEPLDPQRFGDLQWNFAGRGDFNRDGHTDLFFQHVGDGRLLVLLMNRTSMTSSDFLTPFREADLNWRVVTVADMNRDGWPDLVWQHRLSRAIRYWTMNGLTKMDDRMVSPVPGQGWWLRAAPDLNRDGEPDLILQRVADGLLEAWYMNGAERRSDELLDRMPSDPAVTLAGTASSRSFSSQADLIFQNLRNGALQIWFMLGAHLTSSAPISPARDASWKLDGAIMPGRGDALSERPNLLIQNTATGHVEGWFMNGASLVRRHDLVPDRWPASGWRVRAHADFNGDAHHDVLWQHDDGRLALWFLDGPRVLSSQWLEPRLPPNENWFVAGAYDMNTDGRADILWQNRVEGSLRVWFMNGATMTDTRLLAANRSNDLSWRMAGAGDFDGDGKTDIFWWHTLEGWLQIWYMDGTTLLRRDYPEPPRVFDTGWRPVALAHLNADAHPDIVWQHSAGWLQAWLMNGATLTDSAWMTPNNLPDGWRVVGGR